MKLLTVIRESSWTDENFVRRKKEAPKEEGEIENVSIYCESGANSDVEEHVLEHQQKNDQERNFHRIFWGFPPHWIFK